jgi:TolB-like protein/Flp pilus assembly protein TadD
VTCPYPSPITHHPLPIDQVIAIATQIASGLAAAHAKGIIHRDLKPQNILVDKNNRVKILDFGLAKLKGVSSITKESSTLGTVAYMSPEQTMGKEVDHRTDIWSLGVVLYEMLTGMHPFKGDYEQAVVYSILNEDPEPSSSIHPEIPHEFDTVIRKAIAKNSEDRYKQVTDLEDDLKGLLKAIASPAASRRNSITHDLPSIAVLPFKDMSPLQDQEYFCEGIAEELLNALVQIEGLRVAARTSASQFKDTAVDVRAVGRQLNVRSVLEGSVRKAGERLRVTAQLINVKDGFHLFSEKYDRSADDIFAIQDEISLAIVDKLKVKLLHDEKSKLVKRHTENEEAYRLYLQGRYFWNRRHEGELQRGIEYFQKSIAIDPEYALPYSGMADCYFSLGFLDFLAPKEAFGKCKEAALKALELAPDLAEAHASLAIALQFFDWDPAGAEAEFWRAIDLNPNYATVHFFYGFCLTTMGRFDEAITEGRRAIELDPIQPGSRAAHTFTLWVSGRNDGAMANSRALTEFDPNFFLGWHLLGISCAEVGRFAEAENAFRKADALTGGSSTLVLGHMGYALGQAGKRNKARSILQRLLELRKSMYASARHIASLYWLLDQQDEAFEWLQRGFGERDHWLCFAKYLPDLQGMRSDPRFNVLLRKARLTK